MSETYDIELTGSVDNIVSSDEKLLELQYSLGEENIKLIPVTYFVEATDEFPVEYISKYYRHRKPDEKMARFLKKLFNMTFKSN